jgi:DNA-binding response OmpR family regulator
VVRAGDFEVRPAEYQVFVAGRRAPLTVREFQVFQVLFDRIDRVVLRPEIYEQIWKLPMPPRDRAVDVFVRKLRGKLAITAPAGSYVHTHYGVGYRLSLYSEAPTATQPSSAAPAP